MAASEILDLMFPNLQERSQHTPDDDDEGDEEPLTMPCRNLGSDSTVLWRRRAKIRAGLQMTTLLCSVTGCGVRDADQRKDVHQHYSKMP